MFYMHFVSALSQLNFSATEFNCFTRTPVFLHLPIILSKIIKVSPVLTFKKVNKFKVIRLYFSK